MADPAQTHILSHPPVQKAIGKLRAMSVDEEERDWAEARDRALDIATIAICTGLSEDEVRHLAAA